MMMIITHFTSQIIPLAISFGFIYWLFITADKFEGRLQSIGESLGWILIILTLLSALFSFIYSIKLVNEDYIKEGCPVIKVIQEQERPLLDNESQYDSSNTQDNTIKTQDKVNSPKVNNEEDDSLDNQLH